MCVCDKLHGCTPICLCIYALPEPTHLHGNGGGVVDERSGARGVAIGCAEREVAQRCARDGGKADGDRRLGAESYAGNKAGV